jgi:hypothetical protein
MPGIGISPQFSQKKEGSHMKRIVLLLAVFGLVFGAALQAAAQVDVNWRARFDFDLNYQDNTNFFDSEEDGDSEDDFGASQRLRMTFEAEASEMLKGVVEFEYGTATWGDGGSDDDVENDFASISNDEAETEIRRAYVDFFWPGSDLLVRFGKNSFGLPHAWDTNAIHTTSNRPPQIVMNYPFTEEVAVNLFWNRINDSNGTSEEHDEIDAFGFTVPIGLADYGFNLEPYFMYVNIGNDVADAIGFNGTADDDGIPAYFFGFASDFSIDDPLTVYFDFMYGSYNADADILEQSGYLFDAKVEYVMDFFTPALVFWYGSGDNDDATDGSERLPIIDGNTPEFSSFAFDGASTATGALALDIGAGWAGSWGVGFLLEDIVFIDNLTHNFRFVYSKSTSDLQTGEIDYFDDGESFFEINFDHSYDIYENLTAFFELGYVDVNLEDEDGEEIDTSAAMKAAFRLRYSF